MDRLNRTLAGSGLALLVAATGSGCRSTQSQVPPGRPYTNDGRQGAPVAPGPTRLGLTRMPISL